MIKKFRKINVESKDLKYGKKTGITLKEAQDDYMKAFMKSAKTKMNTTYKHLAGFDFEFY